MQEEGRTGSRIAFLRQPRVLRHATPSWMDTRTRRWLEVPGMPKTARHDPKRQGLPMTPYQLAKTECANMLPDGSCLGIKPQDLIDTGQTKHAHPLNHCKIADNERCGYFERIILKIADQPSPTSDPNLHHRRQTAKTEYLKTRKLTIHSNDPCPDCQGPKPQRRRYYEECSTKRRRQATKDRVSAHRAKTRLAVTL